MKLAKIVRRFRVDKPHKFPLSDYDPADTCGLDIEKAEAKAMLANGVKRLSDLQEKLYAQNRWAVLVVFQSMDAAGKERDQACDVGRQSARLRGARLQGAKRGRARSRLSLAHRQSSAGART